MKTWVSDRGTPRVWVLIPVMTAVVTLTYLLGFGLDGLHKASLFGVLVGVIFALIVHIDRRKPITGTLWFQFAWPYPLALATGLVYGFDSTAFGWGIGLSLMLTFAGLFGLPGYLHARKAERRGVEQGYAVDVSVLAGGDVGFVDGVDRLTAQFANPQDLALTADGEIWLADTGNHCLRRIDANGRVGLVAGVPQQAGGDDGERLQARFDNPSRLVIDGLGNVFVLDAHGRRLRKLDTGGVVTTMLNATDLPRGPASITQIAGDLAGGVWIVAGALYRCSPKGKVREMPLRGTPKQGLDGLVLMHRHDGLLLSTYEDYEASTWYKLWRVPLSRETGRVECAPAVPLGEIQPNLQGLISVLPNGVLYGLRQASSHHRERGWVELVRRPLRRDELTVYRLVGRPGPTGLRAPFPFREVAAMAVSQDERLYVLDGSRLLVAYLTRRASGIEAREPTVDAVAGTA